MTSSADRIALIGPGRGAFPYGDFRKLCGFVILCQLNDPLLYLLPLLVARIEALRQAAGFLPVASVKECYRTEERFDRVDPEWQTTKPRLDLIRIRDCSVTR